MKFSNASISSSIGLAPTEESMTTGSVSTQAVSEQHEQQGGQRKVTRSSSISSSSYGSYNDSLSKRSQSTTNSRRRTIFPTVQIKSLRDDSSSVLSTPPTSPSHGIVGDDDDDDESYGQRKSVISPSNLLIESSSFASSLSSCDSSIRHSYIKQISQQKQQQKELQPQAIESTPKSKNNSITTSPSNTFQPIILQSDLVMECDESKLLEDNRKSIPQSPLASSSLSNMTPQNKTQPKQVLYQSNNDNTTSSSFQVRERKETIATTAKQNSSYSFSSSSSPKSSSKKMRNKSNKIDHSFVNSNNPNNSTTASSIHQSLEKQLFHLLHTHQIHNPSVKEFKECWSFASAVKIFYAKENIQVVIDVAGGHGALCALLLMLLPNNKLQSSSLDGVVIDPAENIHNGVFKAWGDFYHNTKVHHVGQRKTLQDVLRYRHEDLRTGLRTEIDRALDIASISPKQILVVACHACQHLTDETLQIACSYGVHVAVMPCCQKDSLSGGSFKELSKRLNMNIGVLMDLLTVGKVMSWNNGRDKGIKYQVKVKLIDEKITPQNRIILCRAKKMEEHDWEEDVIDDAHNRLARAYQKAHGNTKKSMKTMCYKLISSVCIKSVGVGLITGVIISFTLRRRR